jgi:hypothetical protein
MRHVALLLLVVLAAYFLFLKPYLVHRGISYQLKGLYAGVSPLRIGAEEISLLLPEEEGGFLLSLRGLEFELRNRPTLKLRDGMIVE